jgi:heme oxygenase
MLSSETTPQTGQELKVKTAILHEGLEAVLIPHLQAIRAPQDYTNILAAFYGFIYPVEVLIHSQVDTTELNDINERYKAPFIMDDLRSLNYDMTLLCESNDLPQIQNVEQAFGALYVLEGSTLGGKIIANMLLKKEIGLQNDLRYFTAYGKETGPKWMQFQKRLNEFTHENQIQTIITAANETFLKFKIWIQDRLQQPT